VVTRRSRSSCPTVPIGFGIGDWPGACWRPYSPNSPFNRLLPANPRLHRDSSAIVDRLVSDLGPDGPQELVAGNSGTDDDWEIPTYYAQPGDPIFSLDCRRYCQDVLEGTRIPIPDAARPAGGGDGHMTVVQPDGWEYDFWKVASKPRGGGTIVFDGGGRGRVEGSGLRFGTSAALFGNLAGMIRAQELEAGLIDHALVMAVTCSFGGNVYPAEGGGGSECSDRVDSKGRPAPTMGMRFQLDYSDAAIDALGVPAWKKTILRTMARYGIFMDDTGTGSWGIAVESGSTYTSFGHEDLFVRFARRNGARRYEGKYILDLRDGVDWRRLRVVDPCVTRGSC
jgi:hypothetical protein